MNTDREKLYDECQRLTRQRDELLEAAQETVATFDVKEIRALASAALYQGTLLGGQKEAIASVLQHFARSLRLTQAAIAKAGPSSEQP